MVKIIDTLLGKSAANSDEDYMELDLASYEESGGKGPALLVKIATITDLKDTPRVKDEVYSGNIVIVDISRLKMGQDFLRARLKGPQGSSQGCQRRYHRSRRPALRCPDPRCRSRSPATRLVEPKCRRSSRARVPAAIPRSNTCIRQKNIPYFSDILIISAVCPTCGYKFVDTPAPEAQRAGAVHGRD